MLHGVVLQEDICGDAPEALEAPDLQELAHEQGAEAPALESVPYEDRELCLFRNAAAAAEAADAQYLLLPGLWVRVFGDEGHLAVVVYKADAGQALVGCAPVEDRKSVVWGKSVDLGGS